MSQENKGNFFVGELEDGRFVAASSCSPYFCFRADTEEEVFAKVHRALTFYGESEGIGKKIKIKSVTQTVTRLQPTRRVAFDEVLQVVAA